MEEIASAVAPHYLGHSPRNTWLSKSTHWRALARATPPFELRIRGGREGSQARPRYALLVLGGQGPEHWEGGGSEVERD